MGAGAGAPCTGAAKDRAWSQQHPPPAETPVFTGACDAGSLRGPRHAAAHLPGPPASRGGVVLPSLSVPGGEDSEPCDLRAMPRLAQVPTSPVHLAVVNTTRKHACGQLIASGLLLRTVP